MNRQEAFDLAVADIEKQYKQKIFQSADKVVRTVIKTGIPSLDYVLGGGFPRGMITEIFGEEGAGKTTISFTCIKSVLENEGFVLYIDVEGKLDVKYMESCGVDLSRVHVAQPPSGEAAIDIWKKFAEVGGTDLIVLDSVAALHTKREREKEVGDSNVSELARL